MLCVCVCVGRPIKQKILFVVVSCAVFSGYETMVDPDSHLVYG